MYRRVLIPVDLSGQHAATLAATRRIAEPRESKLTLLHVIETLRDVSFEEMHDFYDDLRVKAQRELADLAENLTRDGYDVTREIVFGKRADEILRFANQRSIDLLILRSSPPDRDNPASTFGSVGNQVALLASCSVLLVRL